MKNRKGGYIIIDLEGNDLTNDSFTLEGVYERLEGNYGKAIQLTGISIDDVEKADVFVTAKVIDDDFVIDVYGYTLTIDADDLVASATSTLLMSDIVDADGNARFIEDDITMETIDGVTQSYGKYSLSGSHLMFVIAFSFTATITAETDLAIIEIPDWIYNKIYALGSTTTVVTTTKLQVRNVSGTDAYAEYRCILAKTNNKIYLKNTDEITLDGTSGLARLQFDLLIDTE